MDARYRGSVTGCTRTKHELEGEKKKAGTPNPEVSRLEIYTEARKGKYGIITNPVVQQFIDEATRISQSLDGAESIPAFGPDDVFARTMHHLEHPGRVRAAVRG